MTAKFAKKLEQMEMVEELLTKIKFQIEECNMSYSRWSHSSFYTYWCSSKAERKEDELFACHVDLEAQIMITYEECKRIEDSLVLIKGKINQIENDEEAAELQGYIKNFIGDIDHKYMSEVKDGQ